MSGRRGTVASSSPKHRRRNAAWLAGCCTVTCSSRIVVGSRASTRPRFCAVRFARRVSCLPLAPTRRRLRYRLACNGRRARSGNVRRDGRFLPKWHPPRIVWPDSELLWGRSKCGTLLATLLLRGEGHDDLSVVYSRFGSDRWASTDRGRWRGTHWRELVCGPAEARGTMRRSKYIHRTGR